MRTYSDEGIVIAKLNYGEADRIVALFTKERGKVFFVAKGVRKPKSRKRGGLEIFNRINFLASKTKGLDIITEIEVLSDSLAIRKSLKRMSVAYFFCEAIGRVTREEEENVPVYDLMEKYLKEISTSETLKKTRNNFTRELLNIAGFWPEGKPLLNPDIVLEEVAERNFSSVRIGKKINL